MVSGGGLLFQVRSGPCTIGRVGWQGRYGVPRPAVVDRRKPGSRVEAYGGQKALASEPARTIR